MNEDINYNWKKQLGRVKSMNDMFIFVVFHCEDNWDTFENYTGECCRKEDLRLL